MITKETEAKIKTSLETALKEALELRFSITLPESYSSPQEVIENLKDLRKIVDRLEELYLSTLRVKGELERSASSDKAIAEEAWAQAIHTLNRASAANMESFSGPRERYAEADIETFDVQRAARKSANLASYAYDITESLRVAYRGADGARQDVLNWLRALNFQSHLES